VSDVLEHRDSSEALGAYALGALPGAEHERVRGHLTGCGQCRAELEGLRAAVDALPASVPQIDPPPELKVRLMEIVEAEAELLRAAGEPADKPASTPRRWRWPLLGPRRTLALAGAAMVALAAVIVAVSVGGGTATRMIQAQLSPSLQAAHARATLRVTGTSARLQVSRFPAPPSGHVDELWVKHGASAPRPAGTFVVSSGSVDVAGQVRKGDLVLVTVEPGGGTAAPTTAPVATARA
jgi:anti-sigma-K factor RskA